MLRKESLLLFVAAAAIAGCAPSGGGPDSGDTRVAPEIAPERVPVPVKLTVEEMRALLAAARRGAKSGATAAGEATLNVVVVSVYARDSRGRPVEPFPAIGQAVGESRSLAAGLAGARAALELRGRSWLAGKSAFKLDVPGVAGPVREGAPKLAGGVEGLLLASPRGRQVYVPPSLYLADRPSMERYTALAVSVAGLNTPRPRMHRVFKSTSFVNLAPGGSPLPLYRGNILLKTPTAPVMRAAATTGGHWLAEAQRADGTFYYRYYPTERRYQENRYNFARHCGAVWGLYVLYHKTGRRDRKVLATANRALDWMRRLARDEKRGGKLRMPLYQTPGPTASGVALALLAYVEAVRIGGRKQLLAEAVAVGDLAVEGFQHESGRFYEWWNPRTGNPAGELTFIYHPGELILALAGLHQVSGEKRFLEAAIRGMNAQVKAESEHHRKTKTLPPDAWTVQAVEALERVTPPRKEWRAHAFLLADHLIKGQYGAPTGPAPKAPDYPGGMSNLDPPIPCAAGSRGEGIASAWRLAARAGDRARMDHYRRRLLAAARFALEGQFRAENSFWLPDPALARGGIRQSLVDTSVRIDYVQHCVAAWLGAAEMLEQEREGPGGKP